MKETRRSYYDKLRSSLDNERSSFISHYRDLADYFLPRRAQFSTTDTNRGEKKNTKIINASGPLAVRTLRSGMMAGVTSPARPWFRLSTPDPFMSEIGEVKAWLHLVSQRMSSVFIRSNLYNTLPIVYGDLGVFGTAAMAVEEDFESVIRTYVFPVGTYMVANDEKGRIRTFFREFKLTVRQVVNRFAMGDNGEIDWFVVSDHVKSQYMNGHLEAWVEICQIVYANSDYKPNGIYAKDKKYRSVYYEKGSTSNTSSSYMRNEDDKFLSDKGFDNFKVLVPRWEVSGEDVYGTNAPGMLALGDNKALQLMEKRKAQAVELMVKPPLKGPIELKTQKVSFLPGDVSYVDERAGLKGLSPIYEVNPRVAELMEDISKRERLISRAFYEDLFLMLAQSDRRQITAREIEERHEEKLLALGPVLEQLNQDLLDPLIDITFAIMLQQGLIPPAPEELQGVDLKVEYISIMHQAQKLAGLAGIDRLTGFVGQVADFNPEVLDKIDGDQLIDEYGEITGVPPRIIRSDEAVAELRARRQEAQAQAEQMAMLQQGAGVAKDLSAAKMTGDDALSRLLQQSEAGAIA